MAILCADTVRTVLQLYIPFRVEPCVVGRLGIVKVSLVEGNFCVGLFLWEGNGGYYGDSGRASGPCLAGLPLVAQDDALADTASWLILEQ